MKLKTLLILCLVISSIFIYSLATAEDNGFTTFLPVIAKPTNILFSDNFSDPGSGWPIDDDGETKWSYINDQYEMLIREERSWAGAIAPVSGLANYSVQAKVHRQTGTESDYGLIFDFKNWNNYYIYVMDPGDQWYGVAKFKNGNPEIIIPLTNTSKIGSDQSVNLLKVKRVGKKIDVFVNDQHLDSADDTGFSGNLSVGLYMESDTDAPAAVRYDDFLVWTPHSGLAAATGLDSQAPESAALNSGITVRELFEIGP